MEFGSNKKSISWKIILNALLIIVMLPGFFPFILLIAAYPILLLFGITPKYIINYIENNEIIQLFLLSVLFVILLIYITIEIYLNNRGHTMLYQHVFNWIKKIYHRYD